MFNINFNKVLEWTFIIFYYNNLRILSFITLILMLQLYFTRTISFKSFSINVYKMIYFMRDKKNENWIIELS